MFDASVIANVLYISDGFHTAPFVIIASHTVSRRVSDRSVALPTSCSSDGSSIPIYCVGQAQIQCPTKPLLLRDVLVAPALIKNLISIRQITTDNHVSVEFDPFGLSV